jgi:putative FmdB family regulatory protein
MPTYEYKCLNCDFHFEEFQSMNDDPIEKCPKCGGKVQRLISAGAGMIFKGSGFYLTDYKKSNTSPSKPASDTKTAKPEKSTETKTDKTPTVKAEKQPK